MKKLLAVNLDDDIYQKLEQRAQTYGLTVAAFVRMQLIKLLRGDNENE